MDGDKWGYLDSLVEDGPSIDNRSQAVQYCINQQMQREQL
jgi:hypothetical protein